MRTIIYSAIFLMLALVTHDSKAFTADPGLGDTKACRHVEGGSGFGYVFAVVQAWQQCPPHFKSVVSPAGNTYTQKTTMSGVTLFPLPTDNDPFSPSCYNVEIVIPTY